MTDALSDCELMMRVRLPNWAICGREDAGRPKAGGAIAVLYQLGRANRDGNEDDAPDTPAPPLDRVDADWLDVLIANKLPRAHRNVIRRYYGTFYDPPDHRVRNDLPSAARALLDVEYVALELGWKAA